MDGRADRAADRLDTLEAGLLFPDVDRVEDAGVRPLKARAFIHQLCLAQDDRRGRRGAGVAIEDVRGGHKSCDGRCCHQPRPKCLLNREIDAHFPVSLTALEMARFTRASARLRVSRNPGQKYG